MICCQTWHNDGTIESIRTEKVSIRCVFFWLRWGKLVKGQQFAPPQMLQFYNTFHTKMKIDLADIQGFKGDII